MRKIDELVDAVATNETDTDLSKKLPLADNLLDNAIEGNGVSQIKM